MIYRWSKATSKWKRFQFIHTGFQCFVKVKQKRELDDKYFFSLILNQMSCLSLHELNASNIQKYFRTLFNIKNGRNETNRDEIPSCINFIPSQLKVQQKFKYLFRFNLPLPLLFTNLHIMLSQYNYFLEVRG